MRIYYAHCQAIYGTPQETRDIALLEQVFAGQNPVVISPHDFNDECDRVREAHRLYFASGIEATYQNPLVRQIADGGYQFDGAGTAVMDLVFKPIVKRCQLLAFRALPDGRIPAGVAQEIAWAQEEHTPILEMPSGMYGRRIGIHETREYLREVGQR